MTRIGRNTGRSRRAAGGAVGPRIGGHGRRVGHRTGCIDRTAAPQVGRARVGARVACRDVTYRHIERAAGTGVPERRRPIGNGARSEHGQKDRRESRPPPCREIPHVESPTLKKASAGEARGDATMVHGAVRRNRHRFTRKALVWARVGARAQLGTPAGWRTHLEFFDTATITTVIHQRGRRTVEHHTRADVTCERDRSGDVSAFCVSPTRSGVDHRGAEGRTSLRARHLKRRPLTPFVGVPRGRKVNGPSVRGQLFTMYSLINVETMRSGSRNCATSFMPRFMLAALPRKSRSMSSASSSSRNRSSTMPR